jgi:hypothetical protein
MLLYGRSKSEVIVTARSQECERIAGTMLSIVSTLSKAASVLSAAGLRRIRLAAAQIPSHLAKRRQSYKIASTAPRRNNFTYSGRKQFCSCTRAGPCWAVDWPGTKLL